MIVQKFRIAFWFALAGCLLPVQADLVWTPSEGWQTEGDVLDREPGREDSSPAADLLAEARAEQNDGDNWSALDLYDEVTEQYPDTAFAAEAHYQRGIIYTERRQFKDAFAEFETVVNRYPTFPRYNQVIAGMFELANRIGEGQIPFIWGVIPWIPDEDFGFQVYDAVVDYAPFSEYAPLALLNKAKFAQDDDEPEEAIDALDKLINNYPDSLITPNAYLRLANTYSGLVQGPAYDQGATKDAIKYYEDYLILFPKADDVDEAQQKLANMRDTLAMSKFRLGEFFWLYRNDPLAAEIFLNEAITVDPDSTAATEARELLATIESGAKPPMTPIDWIFGRYEKPRSRQLADDIEVEALDQERFEESTVDVFTPLTGEEPLTPRQPLPFQEIQGVNRPGDLFRSPADNEPQEVEPVFPDAEPAAEEP